MKIAMFVGAFPVLSETFILNQITGLIDRGHDVDVFARGRHDYDALHGDIDRYGLVERVRYFDGMPKDAFARRREVIALIRRHPAWRRRRGLELAARILRARKREPGLNTLDLFRIASPDLERGGYDIVHCQYGTLGTLLLKARALGAIRGKLVTSFRGHDITQKDKFTPGYYAELLDAGDLFLPVSESLKQRLVQLGCPADRIAVLHSGIDCGRFVHRVRARGDDQPTMVVTVARLVEMKGVAYGIDAVARLIAAGHRVSYEIVGDGPLRDELAASVAALGIEASVRFHGWLPHDTLLDVLERGHVLLAPSVTAANGETEGIPNAVKEAMAMGLPVVATAHSGIPELVDDGVSGFLVPERDPRALAERLETLVRSPATWSAMGRAGRAKVEAEYDRKALDDRLVALYAAALESR